MVLQRNLGIFMTRKALPNDYDACWEAVGVEPEALDPVLLTFEPERTAQKAKYMEGALPCFSYDQRRWSVIEFF